MSLKGATAWAAHAQLCTALVCGATCGVAALSIQEALKLELHQAASA